MKRYRLVTVVAALLVLGLSGLAQEKAAPPAKPGQEKMAPQGPMERMKTALQLTPDQEAKLKELRQATAEQQKAFAEQMKKVREEMQALRKDGAAPDLNKTNALIDRMFKIRADQAKAQAKHQADRAKIFTPEQLAKMKNGAQMLPGRGMGMMMRPGMGMGMGRGMAPWMMRGQALRPGMGQMMNRGRMMMNRQGLRQMMNRLRMRIRGLGRGLGIGRGWDE